MKKGGKILYYGLIVVFALVFVGSAVYILDYLFESKEQGDLYDDLANRVPIVSRPIPGAPEVTDPEGENTAGTTGTQTPDTPTEGTVPEDTTSPTVEGGILREYKEIYDMNNHTVGWIYIEGTKVNYPVVQSPERPDYYLNHNFEKKWSPWGAIYVRESCDVNLPSDNVTIYGHHMKDNSMFASLDRYKYRENWEAQPYIYFDTLYEHHTYQIFAVFKTSANVGEGFAYHQFENATTREEYDEFIDVVKDLSFYETGITPQYGEKIICLSTCEYTLDNGRFVVVAVRLD